MVAVRMLVAGGLLYGFARCRGEAGFTRAEWKSAAVTAALLFVGGYGVIAWAEQEVASGVTALLGTTSPLWLVLIQWGRGGGGAFGGGASAARGDGRRPRDAGVVSERSG